MSPQKISAITLCATAIGFFGCRDPFADCLPGFVEIDGECGKSGGSTSDTDPTTSGPPPECGNGMVEQGEECEPPGPGGYGKCTMDCLLDRHCGDMVQDPEEQCDDGTNNGSYNGCMPDCQARGPYCGDMTQDAGEQCDDGVNNGSYNGCMPGCQSRGPYCGDMVQDAGEKCDDGANDGSYNGCMPGCQARGPYCGDMMKHSMEDCEDGNTVDDDMCGNDCKAPACMDGVKEGSEECDDGNGDDNDTCSTLCVVPKCRDGKQQGNEECDDGNDVDNDTCSNDCTLPRSVFMTHDRFSGKMGGIAGANTLCGQAGKDIGAPLGGLWRAWLSDANNSPLTLFDRYFTGHYQLPNASKTSVAKGWGGLSSPLLSKIVVDQSGGLPESPLRSWSNTALGGGGIPNNGAHCNNWTSDTDEYKGRFGDADNVDVNWTNSQAMSNPVFCGTSDFHLYCFQDVPFRIVFVTSETFSGNLGGVTGADAKCAEAAKKNPALPDGGWKAWLSDATDFPADRLDNSFLGWYRLPNGARVARGWADLTNGTAGINLDENGNPLKDPQRSWSNTTASGEKAGDEHCTGWTTSARAVKGRYGTFKETSTYWTDDTHATDNPADCSDQYHLYCIQDGP